MKRAFEETVAKEKKSTTTRNEGIGRDAFESRFGNTLEGLFDFMDKNGDDRIDFEEFRDGVAECCGRMRSDVQLKAFVSLCREPRKEPDDDETGLTESDLSTLFRRAFMISIFAECGKIPDGHATLDTTRLVRSVLRGRKSVTFSELSLWSARCGRSLSRTLGSYTYAVFRVHVDNGDESPSLPGPSRVFRWPVLTTKSVLRREDVFALSLCEETLQRRWCLLYDVSHGRSFERLRFDVIGYNGPTLWIIRDTDGNVFGAYASCAWKDGSKSFFGDPNAFLFSARPQFNVLRTSGDVQEENYMYMNMNGYGVPHGIGFGGSVGNFRLFIDAEFGTERCYERTRGITTFERGRLRKADDRDFMIDSLEVWGLGGDDAASAQRNARDDAAMLRAQARKVDKARFLDDFSKEFLLGKTFNAARGQEGSSTR